MKQQKNIGLAFLFFLLSVLAGIAFIPYQMEIIGHIIADSIDGAPFSIPVVFGIGTLQTGLLIFFASFVGLRLGHKVDLDVPIFRTWFYKSKLPALSKKWVVVSVLGSFIGATLVVLLDKLIFSPVIPNLTEMNLDREKW